MKIALISDQHFGTRNDSLVLLAHMKKFYEEVFFPEIDSRGIRTIISLGDDFDRRKYINFNSLYECQKFFFDPIRQRGLDLHVIVGNHSIYFNNTLKVNSCDLLLQSYAKRTYVELEEIVIDGQKILIVPWVVDYEAGSEKIARSNARYLMGHLAINGFMMNAGHACEDGMSSDLFRKFDKVFTGHFHDKQTWENIHYVGAPYEMMWADFDKPRGFHIFDPKTSELEFIKNPLRLFHKLFYDDSQELHKPQAEYVKDHYIRVIVHRKKDPYKFEEYIEEISDMQPANLFIVEDTQISLNDEGSSESLQVQDTLSILKNYVRSINDVSVDKNKLVGLLTDLYFKANEMSVD